MGRWQLRAAVIAVAMGAFGGMGARADDARHFSFAYDQPHSTATASRRTSSTASSWR